MKIKSKIYRQTVAEINLANNKNHELQWKGWYSKNVIVYSHEQLIWWLFVLQIGKLTFDSLSSTTVRLSSRIFPPRRTCPTNFGHAGSVMSYCLTSPWSQHELYKYLSSRDSKMSDIKPNGKNICDIILRTKAEE